MKFIKGIFLLCVLTTLSLAKEKRTEDVEFKFFHMQEEAYWYSLYNLGELVMKSGLGETFMPNMEMVKQMVEMSSDVYSTAMPPKNPALLKRVFNGGNPRFLNPDNGDPMDFNNFRWMGGSSGPTTGSTFGWTLIKEIEWAKQFNIDNQFGDPGFNEIPGAQERFAGMVLCAEAFMQVEDFINNKENYTFPHRFDEYVTLASISNLAQFIGTQSNDKMRQNRCAIIASMMKQMPANEVSMNLIQLAKHIYENMSEPVWTKDYSLAIQSLTWYGFAAVSEREEVRKKIRFLGNELSNKFVFDTVDLSYMIRALLDVARITGEKKYLEAAIQNYQDMIKKWPFTNDLLSWKESLEADEIAIILGALNSIRVHAADLVGQQNIAQVMTDFFLNYVNKSGLLISAPPVTTIPSYKRKPQEIFHRYPDIPLPEMAGGAYGSAPVFARKIIRGFSGWKVDSTFDTAGAMQLANEMIWFHVDQVSGFPKW